MKYFISSKQRKVSGSTLYFEFQLGDYNGTHWLTDSVYLHADIFDELALFELFSQSINDFYYYGPTRISKDDWKILIFNAQKKESWKCAINELSFWVDNCFTKYDCFTICGI